MSRDYLSIGPVPPEESCQQVGSDHYDPVKANKECKQYIQLLRRAFGDEPDGAKLSIKNFPHDFGTYSEVVCYYDSDKPESIDFAFKCESNSPQE